MSGKRADRAPGSGGRGACVLGIDFGTLSARAVVARVQDGSVLSDSVADYAHGVMDRTLSAGDGRDLPPDFALQDPADYLEALRASVRGAVAGSGVDPADIVGLGLDATSASVLVTDADGTPLCDIPEFRSNPHAYMKLWKHHGAQAQVERIVSLARERSEPWLERYGGTLSAEMLLPKALETFERAPEVYRAAAEIVDALDWLTWRLTGNLVYAAGDSGYKRMYQDGRYPARDYLEALDAGFGDVYAEKMRHPVVPLGARVGGLTPRWARELGLHAGTAVAAGNIDAHVHAAAVDAVRPGQLTGVLGTSACWIVPAVGYHRVPGIFGVVDGGVVDGAWAFEGGQSAVGDTFQWFIDTGVPEPYKQEARRRGVSVFQVLGERASRQRIGQSGLVALDWFNGNRSILVDAELSGLVVGETLQTRPEDRYRALLESSVFGARVIIENFESHGVPIHEIRAAGGLLKDPFLMQMYADITRRPISVATVAQAGALGSAIHGAVAAGAYPTVVQAADAMGGVQERAYVPHAEAAERYDRLFDLYRRLYALMGERDETMHELKHIRREALAVAREPAGLSE